MCSCGETNVSFKYKTIYMLKLPRFPQALKHPNAKHCPKIPYDLKYLKRSFQNTLKIDPKSQMIQII